MLGFTEHPGSESGPWRIQWLVGFADEESPFEGKFSSHVGCYSCDGWMHMVVNCQIVDRLLDRTIFVGGLVSDVRCFLKVYFTF